MKRIIIIFLATVMVTAGCEYLEPRPIQDLSTDELLSAADYGEGLVTKAYANLNPYYDINSEYYTDNAVPSNTGSNLLALGGWTLETNPIGNWNQWYNSIAYCNQYLELGQDLLYSVSDSTLNSILQKNRRAEAFYLRAWYHWKLLQTYGGYAAGESEALGVPVVTESLTREDNLDLPRNTYEEVVAQIAEDLDSVIAVLPLMYDGSSLTDNITNRGRASGLAAMALKARVYLYAASPAYGPSTPELWERAADAAYAAIDASGGLTDLDSYGDFNDFSSYNYIWIQPPFTSNAWERTYYPPSLYGDGHANPSQNLVDAFPAGDGYPIDESTGYNENFPYDNRDPRFNRFIFHNWDNYNGNRIRIYEGGADAPGGLSQRGTRTGYYMKKLLSKNVRLTPGDVTSDIKFYVYLDRTELYLNFAEAANEAYGPTAGPGYTFTAADALATIRERAGIDSDPGLSGYQDQYLDDAAATGKAAFRDLVHNERRIELAFEGFRFWDIRRLNQPLNHTVKGAVIDESDVAFLPELATNIALDASPTDDYSPYGNPDNLNNGTTGGSAWHNWYSAETWRYVQYNLGIYENLDGTTSTYQIQDMEVYWWTDGGGILYPDSIYVEVWDLETNQWVEVYSDYSGVTQDYWSADIDPDVNTDRIRLNFRGPASCGIWEWLVYGIPYEPASFTYEYVDVEDHTFQEYMRYVPLPYSQTLTMSNLKQNTGW
ncbi:MAG: RagB/SusD family nutrient uptake outer membrane protein [Bacteroidales bacterium]|nr:RagB/SusD family nutrient uptake outer membrane protein [Bacteroidales bacterium]